MIRLALILLFLIVILLSGRTEAFLPHGGGNCPPSTDGAFLQPPSQIGCILTDHLGNTYSYPSSGFPGLSVLQRNGANFYTSTGFQLNQGRKPYVWVYTVSSSNTNNVAVPLWVNVETAQDAVTPAQGDIANWAKVGTTTYKTIGAAGAAGALASGTTVEVLPMPAGLPVYFESNAQGYSITSTLTNFTILCDGPGAFGYATSPSPLPGQGFIADDANGFKLNGCEITGARDGNGQQRGLNMAGGVQGLTLIGTFMHDNDFGLQSGGNNGTVILTNARFDHNGSGLNGSATHNVYMGADYTDLAHLTTMVISGGYSRCTNHNGYQLKMRGAIGTITNYTAADPSTEGYTDCTSIGAVDMPCGGQYTIGGAGTGQGAVLSAGPLMDNHTALIAYAEELVGTVTNCNNPETAAPYATNTLLVQNAWLILDYPGVMHVFNIGAPTNTTPSITVQNSKIVCNSALVTALGACDFAHVMATGPGAANVTDGGGNIYYNNRTAAGLGAYPALPAVP